MTSTGNTSNTAHQRHVAASASANTAQETISATRRTRSNPTTNTTSTSSSPIVSLISKMTLLMSLLFRILLWPLSKASKILFPPKDLDGLTNSRAVLEAARRFVHHYQSLCAPGVYNPFSSQSYQTCLKDAQRSQQCLLLYIHSPLHPNSDTFLRKFMVDNEHLIYLLQQHQPLVCGVSLHSPEGEFLSKQQFGVTEYPFLAVLGCRQATNNSRNGTVELLLKMEGMPSSPQDLCTHLSFCMDRHSAQIAQAEARRIQREEEARLRQEQDREYQEALRLDREREEQQRNIQEQIRQDQERQKHEAVLKSQAQQNKLLKAQALLAAGEPPSTIPRMDVSNVRLTLPSGTRLQRRFRAEETVEHIRAYLILYFAENSSARIEQFSFSTNYPKRTFQDIDVDNQMTLREAGLVPQAVLMVQDLDA